MELNEKRIISHLARKLKNGRLILVVGPYFPDEKRLDEFFKSQGKNEPRDFSVRFSELIQERGEDETTSEFAKFQERATPSRAHMAVCRFRLPAVFSLTWDNLFEKAFEKDGARFESANLRVRAPVKSLQDTVIGNFFHDREKGCPIYFSDNDLDLFAENELETVRWLRSLVSSNTFLFMGFPPETAVFRLLRVIMIPGLAKNSSPGFMVCSGKDSSNVKHRGFTPLVWEKPIIDLFLDLEEKKDFPDELLDDPLNPIPWQKFRMAMENACKWVTTEGILPREMVIEKGTLKLKDIFVEPSLKKGMFYAEELSAETASTGSRETEIIRLLMSANLNETKKGLSLVGRTGLTSTIIVERLEKLAGDSMTDKAGFSEIRKKAGILLESYKTQSDNWSSLPAEMKPVDLFKSKQNIIVIGEPASGKTSLFRWLVTECLERKLPEIPLFIEMKEFDSKRFLTLMEFFVAKIVSLDDSLAENEAVQKIQDGGIFFFLDGLDEIRDSKTRQFVANQLTTMMKENDKNRFLISSRPAGYRDIPSFSQVHYTVQPFDQKQIDEFVEKWSALLSKMIREQKPGEIKARFQEVLNSSAQARILARNPLILTIMGLFSRRGDAITKKVKLYESAVSTFAYQWENVKFEMIKQNLSFPDCETIMKSLADAALKMHSAQIHREQEGIGYDAIEDLIAESFIRWGDRTFDPLKAAKDFLTAVNKRMGCFVERSPGIYGFVHLSFQEYLAAKSLCQMGIEQIIHFVQERIHDPWWEEVILNTASILESGNAEKLIEAIRNAKTGFENEIHLDLCLAVKCLREASVTEEFRKNLLSEFLELFSRDEIFHKGLKVLQNLGSQALCLEDKLLAFLSHESVHVRLSTIRYFGQIGEKSRFISKFLEMLKDNNWIVRQSAVEFFTGFGKDGIQFIPQFLKMLKDEDEDVRQSAVEFFTGFGKDGIQFAPHILEMVKDKEWSVRRSAVEFFKDIGKDGIQFVPQFLKMLKNEDEDVRQFAVEFFTGFEKDGIQFAPHILEMVKDKEWSVRQSAVEFFKDIGKDGIQFAPQFLKMLKDEEWSVRRSAVEFFTGFGKDGIQFAPQFLEMLKDKEWSVRRSAVIFFTGLGKDGIQFAPHILEMLKNNHKDFRRSAVIFFKDLGKDGIQFAPHILEMLKDEDRDVRQSAVKFFNGLGKDGIQFAPHILEMLRDKDRDVRKSAAEFFNGLGKDGIQFAPHILEMLKDKDALVCQSAAEFFNGLGKDGIQFAPQFLEMLKDKDRDVRKSAVEFFRVLGKDGIQFAPNILEMLNDENLKVRRSAVEFFNGLGKDGIQFAPPILEMLKDKYYRVSLSAFRCLRSWARLDRENFLPEMAASLNRESFFKSSKNPLETKIEHLVKQTSNICSGKSLFPTPTPFGMNEIDEFSSQIQDLGTFVLSLVIKEKIPLGQIIAGKDFDTLVRTFRLTALVRNSLDWLDTLFINPSLELADLKRLWNLEAPVPYLTSLVGSSLSTAEKEMDDVFGLEPGPQPKIGKVLLAYHLQKSCFSSIDAPTESIDPDQLRKGILAVAYKHRLKKIPLTSENAVPFFLLLAEEIALWGIPTGSGSPLLDRVKLSGVHFSGGSREVEDRLGFSLDFTQKVFPKYFQAKDFFEARESILKKMVIEIPSFPFIDIDYFFGLHEHKTFKLPKRNIGAAAVDCMFYLVEDNRKRLEPLVIEAMETNNFKIFQDKVTPLYPLDSNELRSLADVLETNCNSKKTASLDTATFILSDAIRNSKNIPLEVLDTLIKFIKNKTSRNKRESLPQAYNALLERQEFSANAYILDFLIGDLENEVLKTEDAWWLAVKMRYNMNRKQILRLRDAIKEKLAILGKAGNDLLEVMNSVC